jgi:CheY-like chemotaxis protein
MEQAPQTRVIMATGHAGDQDESKSLLELARAVLLKPFDLRSLLTTVSQALAS